MAIKVAHSFVEVIGRVNVCEEHVPYAEIEGRLVTSLSKNATHVYVAATDRYRIYISIRTTTERIPLATVPLLRINA